MELELGELAHRYRLELRGDPHIVIDGICTLQRGRRGGLAFLANSRYAKYLDNTAASAVVLAPHYAPRCRVAALLASDPYAVYARIAALFTQTAPLATGVHERAWVHPQARIAASASVGPGAVVEQGSRIGERSYVGPGCIVAQNCRIGDDTRLQANVTLCSGVRVGDRVVLHPGAVLGSRGFGLARDDQGWIEVPQLGGVSVGDDVEIGANTTIDRGALEDTVIGEGVKLDNQIQIGHNVNIGAHTAIAGGTGIAGSTVIGQRCMIGGNVGINGHIRIADDVVIMGMAMVTKSLLDKGLYASGMPAEAAPAWRRTVARIRRLDKLYKLVSKLSSGSANREKQS